MESTISLPMHSGLSRAKIKSRLNDIYRLTCTELFYGMMHEVFYSHKRMDLPEIREEMDEFMRWQPCYNGNPYRMIDSRFSCQFGINCLNKSAEKRYDKWKQKRIDGAVWPRIEEYPKERLLATELMYAFYSEVFRKRITFEILGVSLQFVLDDIPTKEKVFDNVQRICGAYLEYYASATTLDRYRKWQEYIPKKYRR